MCKTRTVKVRVGKLLLVADAIELLTGMIARGESAMGRDPKDALKMWAGHLRHMAGADIPQKGTPHAEAIEEAFLPV